MRGFSNLRGERENVVLYRICPRSICENGHVFETVDGVKKPPPLTCSVCKGHGIVPASQADIRAAVRA